MSVDGQLDLLKEYYSQESMEKIKKYLQKNASLISVGRINNLEDSTKMYELMFSGNGMDKLFMACIEVGLNKYNDSNLWVLLLEEGMEKCSKQNEQDHQEILNGCKAYYVDLPNSIRGFKYISCLKWGINKAYQLNVMVECECHQDLNQKRFIFDQLEIFLKEEIDRNSLNDEYDKYSLLMDKYDLAYPFDCDAIRKLSTCWSVLLKHQKLNIVTGQSCYGHLDNNSQYPWIKFTPS